MKPSRYGPFPYSPIIHRPALKWPDGAHVALWIIPNIEFFALDEKVPPGSGGTGVPVPDVPTWSARDYGNRVGVFRLMEVLEKHGIRATRGAQQRAVHRAPRHHQGGQQAEMGMDGPLREQYPPPQCRSRPARSRASSRTRSP